MVIARQVDESMLKKWAEKRCPLKKISCQKRYYRISSRKAIVVVDAARISHDFTTTSW